jgi:uncharacterized protein YjbJ (UPF0337 family)
LCDQWLPLFSGTLVAMSSSTRAEAFHGMNGTVKEVLGTLTNNPTLEGTGAGEKIARKVQGKSGQIEKVLKQ